MGLAERPDAGSVRGACQCRIQWEGEAAGFGGMTITERLSVQDLPSSCVKQHAATSRRLSNCWSMTSSVQAAKAPPPTPDCGPTSTHSTPSARTRPACSELPTHEGQVVATMQLSFIPGRARRGALRAQIEGVRVTQDHRSSGLGAAMFVWAIDKSRRRGCALAQLTTDKVRADALRFYERLGFVASHEGLKLAL